MLNMIIQLLLLMLLITRLYAKGGYKLSLPLLVGIIVINPICSMLCLPFSFLYYIVVCSCLVMLYYNLNISSKYWYFFLFIGIFTSFFDMLTYPLITLGFPLILYILLNDTTLLLKMKQVLVASFCWGIGYVGMWLGKWVIASIFTRTNVLLEAYNSVKFRLSGHLVENPSLAITMENAITRNIDVFNNSIAIFLCEILFLTIIVMLCFNKKHKTKVKTAIHLPLLFVGLYPFVWWSVCQNHSIVHPYMAHRIFSITILALVYSSVYLFDKKTSLCNTDNENK